MAATTNDTLVLNTAHADKVHQLSAPTDLHGLTDEKLKTLLNGMILHIIHLVGADHGFVLLKDAQGAMYAAASGPSAVRGDPPLFSEALVQQVMQAGTAVLAADDGILPAGVGSVLCAPIKSDDVVAGVIYLGSGETGLWQQAHVDVIGFVAGYTALAIDNARLRNACAENRRLVDAGRATLNLSHSVKNILQMISGAAEVVDFGLRTNQIHRVKRSWDILKPNLDRMKKYTLEMLDYSKERPLNLGPCDFNRVIQGAIESLKSQLKVKNSKINIRIDQKIPRVELDGERIHEMALNLILNAVDVIDNSGGLVSVETRYDPERQVISLAVTDNGPGISDEMKERIFTPFESDKKKFGTGLGMAIAKQIIDQHNGVIEIDSKLCHGTTFTVTMPARIAANPA